MKRDLILLAEALRTDVKRTAGRQGLLNHALGGQSPAAAAHPSIGRYNPRRSGLLAQLKDRLPESSPAPVMRALGRCEAGPTVPG